MSAKRKALTAAVTAVAVFSGFQFGQRSRVNLSEVKPYMQTVAECALQDTKIDFVVIDGGRTLEEQRANIAHGRSWTMKSRHITGDAIDVAAFVDGKITFAPEPYTEIARAFNACSAKLDIPIVWGGEWRQKDLVHFEGDRKRYP